jgi:hypothetical protein
MKSKKLSALFYFSFAIFISVFIYLIFALPSLHRPLVADDAVFAPDSENPQFGLICVWHPPLYSDILRILVYFLGIKREQLRFFGVFCFIAILVLIYIISQQVTKKRNVSFLACLLFTIHPWAIQGSLILDIDNTILVVLLTFFLLYFIKNYEAFRLKNYLLSGLLFFACLWAKLSTPLLLPFSILIFYFLRGKTKEGIAYTFSTATIGTGLFFISWALYAHFYKLNFVSVFERSISVLSRGPAGSSFLALQELALRFIRVSLWMGLYLFLLWSVILILRIKDYYIGKKSVEIKDLLILYTMIIFSSYIFIGGTSYGFAKHQYPILPVLSIIVASFISNLRLEISKKQLFFYILLGLVFLIIENIYIKDLLYRVNYLLRKISIFSPQNLKAFFIDFSFRMSLYFITFIFGTLLIWFLDRKKNILSIAGVFLLVLIMVSSLSYDFRHLGARYFTTYCYGRDRENYKQLTGVFKYILNQKPDKLIIGQDDILFNLGLKYYSEYAYYLLWDDRDKFLKAIRDRRVSCVSYCFTWNALLSYREIFFHPQVIKTLEEQYNFFPIGEYSVWIRK